MELILEAINTFIYFLCVKDIGELFLGYRCKRQNLKLIYLSVLSLLTAIIMLYTNIWLVLIAHFFSIVVVSWVCFDEVWQSILGLYFGTTAVLSMLSSLFEVVLQEVILFFKIKVINDILNVVALFGVLLFIRLIGKYFHNRYKNGLRSIGVRYWLLFVMTMFFDATVVVILGDFINRTMQAERKYIIVFLYLCVVIGLLIQLILLINTLVTRNIYKENEKLAKQFLESQKEHYQYLEKREYETKKFRHDIKNHLMLVENLIATKKYDEAEAYLNDLNLKMLSFGGIIGVNNGIADAILNRFNMEAEEKGVKLIVKGHFPMTCYITAYDLCTILSNLLSNAIQAEHEAGGKEVLVNIKYTDSNVMITVENDYVHELNESDGVFKSTKTDNLRHGFGLHNVNECVEENGGYLSISTENRRFKVKVMLVNENGEGL